MIPWITVFTEQWFSNCNGARYSRNYSLTLHVPSIQHLAFNTWACDPCLDKYTGPGPKRLKTTGTEGQDTVRLTQGMQIMLLKMEIHIKQLISIY